MHPGKKIVENEGIFSCAFYLSKRAQRSTLTENENESKLKSIAHVLIESNTCLKVGVLCANICSNSLGILRCNVAVIVCIYR